MNYLIQVILVLALAVAVYASPASQLRVQYAGVKGSYVITFTTDSSASSSTVYSKTRNLAKDLETPYISYGTTKSSLHKKVKGSASVYEDADYKYQATINNVLITGLEADTKYYYKAISGTDMSDVRSFTTADPSVWAVYGDFGLKNDQSLDSLLSGAHDSYHGVLHIGDIAYNLQNEHGKRGDLFMEAIEPITSSMVYMTAPGNHEHYANFSQYIGRFSGQEVVGHNSGSNTLLWYSFEMGNVHFTSIDTELYAYFPDPAQQARQVAWLEADLIYANQNRDKYPWLIMWGHKCDWQDNVDFTDFRRLANGYGVDLYICGHQHNYQRLFPGLQHQVQTYDDNTVYENPKYWTQVVVGSPGCQEKVSGGKSPYKGGTAAFFVSYGYALLSTPDSETLKWTYIQTHAGRTENAIDQEAVEFINAQNSKIPVELRDTPVEMDHMTMIQKNHGPRSKEFEEKIKNSPKLSKPSPFSYAK